MMANYCKTCRTLRQLHPQRVLPLRSTQTSIFYHSPNSPSQAQTAHVQQCTPTLLHCRTLQGCCRVLILHGSSGHNGAVLLYTSLQRRLAEGNSSCNFLEPMVVGLTTALLHLPNPDARTSREMQVGELYHDFGYQLHAIEHTTEFWTPPD